jgi:HNH endonuclease
MKALEDEKIFGPHHVKRMNWFSERYDMVFRLHLNPKGKRIYVGDSQSRLCRYCGLSAPATTFRKVAHAIPEQIGNKQFIDRCECDVCNEHFSRMIEDDFAKWTMPLRTLGRVQGKRGAPTHKTSDENLRIDVESPHELKISVLAEDPRYTVDEAGQSITFKMERQPYVPMGVFKCLVKMALAGMPISENSKVQHLKRWILEPTHSFESYPYKPLNILTQSIPGPLPHDQLACFLLRRQPICTDSPYLVFVLQFSNSMLQIALPMHLEDEAILSNGTYETHPFPHLWGNLDHESTYGKSTYRVEDLSSPALVQGDVVSIKMGYEQRIRVS